MSPTVSSVTASRRVLLGALHPEPRVFAERVAAFGSAVDWSWVLARAGTHKVATLLVRRMDELSVTECLSSEVRARAASIRDRAATRARRARRTLQAVSEALSDRDVPFLVVKGSVLAEHAFGDPTLRPFADVDIVVPAGQLERAEEAVRSLGYRFNCPMIRQLAFVPLHARPNGHDDAVVPELLTRTLYRRYHCHFAFDPPPEGELLPVDMHWNITLPGVLRLSGDELWAHTRALEVSGQPVSTLDLEATLLHVATHALFGGFTSFRLFHLTDVAWLLTRCAADYRPERLRGLAHAWRAEAYLDAALCLLERLLDCRPPAVITRVRRPIAARYLFDAVTTGRALFEPRPTRSLRHFASRVRRETLWDLGLARVPRRGARIVRRTIRARLGGSRGAGGGRQLTTEG
jgi:hypothetical protein